MSAVAAQSNQQTPKPTVFQTTDQTEEEHLKNISQNLDVAMNKPTKTNVKQIQAAINQDPLDETARKQAEDFEANKTPVANPVDKDKLIHKLLWFTRPKWGDVGAGEVFKEKVKYVDLKGGQKTR